jgi:hypothetical protein
MPKIISRGKSSPRRREFLSGLPRPSFATGLYRRSGSNVKNPGHDSPGTYGRVRGYKSFLSKDLVGKPRPVVGAPIKKEAYMGGSVYFCEKCQQL